ncbi:TetR/AcrR family transcriptional regulator [Mycobacterium sp. smrl_JER01]|uniref:TetR/AcrR family transcriptional regulator n=1 Tax=Mycobacterium sp. smrl_JER01 TaxID=3402633 RepID=UPI003AC1E1BE
MAARVDRQSRRGDGEAKSASRRGDIIEAAVNVFAERGYVGASVREIAERLGISKGNLTYYFAVKDDLLFEIVTDLHDSFLQLAASWSMPPGTSARDVLHNALRAHVLLVTERLHQTRVSYEAFRYLTDNRRATIIDKRDRYEAALRVLIDQCRRDLTGADDSCAAVQARTVLGMLNWPYQWYSTHGSVDPEQLADIVTEMALRSLQL